MYWLDLLQCTDGVVEVKVLNKPIRNLFRSLHRAFRRIKLPYRGRFLTLGAA